MKASSFGSLGSADSPRSAGSPLSAPARHRLAMSAPDLSELEKIRKLHASVHFPPGAELGHELRRHRAPTSPDSPASARPRAPQSARRAAEPPPKSATAAARARSASAKRRSSKKKKAGAPPVRARQQAPLTHARGAEAVQGERRRRQEEKEESSKGAGRRSRRRCCCCCARCGAQQACGQVQAGQGEGRQERCALIAARRGRVHCTV
jgi:hypothetical protein